MPALLKCHAARHARHEACRLSILLESQIACQPVTVLLFHPARYAQSVVLCLLMKQLPAQP